MEVALYDTSARRQTVSLTVNRDLYAKVRAAGINASRVAEAALSQALKAYETERLREEIRQDMRALAEYLERHGDPVAEWREIFEGDDAA